MAKESALPRFDGVRVVRRIQSGGSIDLFEATQMPLGRPVLIKALSSSILPSSPLAAALEQEARLLVKLQHPGVPRLYDLVRRDEGLWLVVEYIDGWSLRELLGAGPIDQVPAVAIVLAVASALQHAHDLGIVHRNLRPEKILVARDGTVKIVGFSAEIGQELETPALQKHHDLGLYFAPEQLVGEPVAPPADIFALGGVFYEMLTGQRPFANDDIREEKRRIRHAAPTLLPTLVSEIAPAVERSIYRCLEKLPSDRFSSAAELAAALEGVLTHVEPLVLRTHTQRMLTDRGLLSPSLLPSQSSLPRPTAPSLATAAWGMLLCLALVIAGGLWFHWMEGDARGEKPSRRALELKPADAAFLRVVAEPWAHVIVDGQRVETTPFAHPIPLRAGTHYVRLEHPNAPVEKRTLHLSAGETLLLDVRMDVPAAKTTVVLDAAADASNEAASP